MNDALIQKFKSNWQKPDAAERPNYALFLTELCDASAFRLRSRRSRPPVDTANA